MEQHQIETMLKEEKYEELAELLEEEDYEEYSMLTLIRIYLKLGEEKKAGKVLRKLKRLFPSGEFWQEVQRISKVIEEENIEEYINSLHSFGGKKSQKTVAKDEKKNEDKIKIQQSNSKEANTSELFVTQGQSEEMDSKEATGKKKLSLASVFGQGKKKVKKQRMIPETIKMYFEDVAGMEYVQTQLDKFYKLLRFQNERKQYDFNAELIKTTHFAVTGARGSGKTLVGTIISSLLYDFGIRGENQPIKVDAREVQMAYESDKSEGITLLFAELSDVTVIVENIQDWFADDNTDISRMLLLSMEKLMEERKDEISIILTGTSEAMKKALIQNETLEDVFHKIIEIPSYSTVELYEIAEKLAEQRALRIHKTAEKTLMRKIDMERKSADFMNAITLGRYLDEASVKMAERFYENDLETEADMVYLMPEDFEMEMEEESLEELLQQFDNLTGLHSVKTQLKKRIQTALAEEKAIQAGASRKGGHGSLHMVFTGNPGTGKTTVARMIGKIYQQLGVLPRGSHIVECTRSGLVGMYVGHTAKLVQEKVKEAMGGILFIDEAYALCRGDHDTYGHEAVDELIAQMENNKDNLMVILAGYKKEMAEFLDSNPGFSSRIRNTIEFEDYSTEEMTDIFKYMVKGNRMRLGADTSDALYQMLDIKSRVSDFGNARGVRNLFEEVKEAMNERILTMHTKGIPVNKNQYDIIGKEDIETVMGRKSKNEKTLEELVEELNNLTGLESVKRKVQEMIDDIQVKEYMKSQSLVYDTAHGTLHLVFKGNAGTGKTTVARLLGQIYRKLGVLSKNVFVETGRKDLVANYLGQTAGKVIKKIEEAEGGILFIDEAYTLNGGPQDEYGHEAIHTLVAELENRRENLMVIVAGYEQEMNQFLEMNQGLASRLSNEILFEDYTDEELLQIFKYQAEKKGLLISSELDSVILEKITEQKNIVKDFGNARGVRNILERVIKRKNSRIALLLRSGQIPDGETVNRLQEEDFQ